MEWPTLPKAHNGVVDNAINRQCYMRTHFVHVQWSDVGHTEQGPTDNLSGYLSLGQLTCEATALAILRVEDTQLHHVRPRND